LSNEIATKALLAQARWFARDLVRVAGEGCVQAVVVTGSAATREPAWLCGRDNSITILSDLDLYVIVRTGSATASVRRAIEDISCPVVLGGVRLAGGISSAVVSADELADFVDRPGTRVLRACGRVVWGDDKVLAGMQDRTPAPMPAGEALYLIENRVAEFVGSRRGDGYPLQGGASTEGNRPGGDRRDTASNTETNPEGPAAAVESSSSDDREDVTGATWLRYCELKLAESLVDAILILRGQWTPGRQERDRAMDQMLGSGVSCPIGSAFAESTRRARHAYQGGADTEALRPPKDILDRARDVWLDIARGTLGPASAEMPELVRKRCGAGRWVANAREFSAMSRRYGARRFTALARSARFAAFSPVSALRLVVLCGEFLPHHRLTAHLTRYVVRLTRVLGSGDGYVTERARRVRRRIG